MCVRITRLFQLQRPTAGFGVVAVRLCGQVWKSVCPRLASLDARTPSPRGADSHDSAPLFLALGFLLSPFEAVV